MKRTILTLITILGFISGVGNLRADDRNKGQQKIKAALERLAEKCGSDNAKTVFISKNPVSGFLIAKYDINSIRCKSGNSTLKSAIKTFEKECNSGLGYSYAGPDTPGVYEVSIGGGNVQLRQDDQAFWIIKYKNTDDPRLLDIYSLALSDNPDGSITGTVASVTMNRSEFPDNNSFGLLKEAGKEKKKFVLEGYVDQDIADSCYNVYMGNVNEELTDADLVDRVVVKDKQFRYEADIDEIKAGRIRALFPGDELCSAWIDLFFVPDFTLKVSVHDGFYNIKNKNAYNLMVKEAMNKFYQIDESGSPINTNNEVKVARKVGNGELTPGEEASKFVISIQSYLQLQEQLGKQLKFASNLTGVAYDFKQTEMNKIFNQIEENFKSISGVIEKYSSNVNESEIDPEQLAVILNAYQYLLDAIQSQLRFVSNLTGVAYDFKQTNLNRFSNLLNTTTNGMSKMIDKYASTISQIDTISIVNTLIEDL